MNTKRGLPSTLKMRHDVHFVEELASRSGAPIGRMIPIDRLEPNSQQPRMEIGDLTELAASIREKGVLEPILVRPSEVGGRFMIISGERRYRASLLAGLEEMPCIEMDVDDQAVAEIALIENLQRKDLTPFEEAEGLQALADRFGYTHEEIAKKIGKSRSSVTESLSLCSMPAEIKELCRLADITSKAMLLQIVRQPSIDAMRALIDRISSQGLTRDQVRKVAKPKPASRQKPFQYKFQSPEKEFALEIKFRRSNVELEELRRALTAALMHVESVMSKADQEGKDNSSEEMVEVV
ncbi:MAG: ParB/RepB/Spo0J family partition protein [Blastocatellia bacterium]|nr:ParB/RepB/Spo0J family partition protein [Blastocatellia bacterium]